MNSDPLGREFDPVNFEVLTEPTVALLRLAAVCAVGGPPASILTEVDQAISAGVTAAAIAEALSAISPIVGMPRIVSAAPAIALSLGYEIELLGDELGHHEE